MCYDGEGRRQLYQDRPAANIRSALRGRAGPAQDGTGRHRAGRDHDGRQIRFGQDSGVLQIGLDSDAVVAVSCDNCDPVTNLRPGHRYRANGSVVLDRNETERRS